MTVCKDFENDEGVLGKSGCKGDTYLESCPSGPRDSLRLRLLLLPRLSCSSSCCWWLSIRKVGDSKAGTDEENLVVHNICVSRAERAFRVTVGVVRHRLHQARTRCTRLQSPEMIMNRQTSIAKCWSIGRGGHFERGRPRLCPCTKFPLFSH